MRICRSLRRKAERILETGQVGDGGVKAPAVRDDGSFEYLQLHQTQAEASPVVRLRRLPAVNGGKNDGRERR